jgi:ribosomal protein L40E
MPTRSHNVILEIGFGQAMIIMLALVAICGCRKDVAAEASDSDANGYLCLKCGAKLYTARSVFIGPQCPKCNANDLTEVVGYPCSKDQHLTIAPRTRDRQNGSVCEQCQGPLRDMRLPREKELKAWGATKAL